MLEPKKTAIFVILWTSIFGFGQDKPLTKTAASLPGFFIPNTSGGSAKKPLIADPDVLAMLPTNQGRVLFTASGAFFATTSHKAPLETQQLTSKDQANTGDFQTQVIFNSGFPASIAAKRNIVPRFEDPIAGPINMLIGPRSHWQTGLKSYQRLVYEDVWEGIDLTYLNGTSKLQFQVEIQPYARIQDASFTTGAQRLRLTEHGHLEASIADAKAIYEKPSAYQIIHGKRLEIPIAYGVQSNGLYGFTLGDYDPAFKVQIQSSVVWSTFFGGPGGIGSDIANGVVVDSSGNIYVTGSTPSADFPVTAGSLFDSHQGSVDCFISKMNPAGTALIFATFLGGSQSDIGYDIALDSLNQPVIAGVTTSPDFPVSAMVYQDTYAGGFSDVFVTKLSQDGSQFVFSTFIGGGGVDHVNALVLGPSENIYLAGSTRSFDFPVPPTTFDETYNGNRDAFFAILEHDGSDLINFSFLGGSSTDSANDIALGPNHEIFLTGVTESKEFPRPSPGPSSPNKLFINREGVFVCKLDANGTVLQYSTLLDSGDDDIGHGIAVDAMGHAIVTGQAGVNGFPITAGAISPGPNPAGGIFVTKLTPDTGLLVYSAQFPGSSLDAAYDIHVDTNGMATITGVTRSEFFPLTPGGFDTTFDSRGDVFLAQLNAAGSALNSSTFLGGESFESVNALAVTPAGDFVVVGHTGSDDFPLTPNAFQTETNGLEDAFVSTISADMTTLMVSTRLGGTGEERDPRVALDDDAHIYVAGVSFKSAFPTTPGAFQTSFGGGYADLFVAKLNQTASEYLYATFLGGSEAEEIAGLAVDANGSAFITGNTRSADFPTTPQSFAPKFQGFQDVFVTKLNPTGSGLVFSTYLGTESEESAVDIALDRQGNAVVVGNTISSSFPTTPNAFQPQLAGGQDSFVIKFSPDGDQLTFSSYLGGDLQDHGYTVAIDSGNFIYVGGSTNSNLFPTTTNAFMDTRRGPSDGFVTKIHPTGKALQYSSLFGDGGSESIYALDVDSFGNVYISGYTTSNVLPSMDGAYSESRTPAFASKLSTVIPSVHYSTFLGTNEFFNPTDLAVNSRQEVLIVGHRNRNYPTTFCAPITSELGNSSSFLTQLNREGTGMLFSTRIGGSLSDEVTAIALDRNDQVIITGYARSYDFPSTPGGISEAPIGSTSPFLMKMSPQYPIHITPPSLALGLQTPVFTVQDDCGVNPVDTYTWRTYPETSFTDLGDTLSFDVPPNRTTRLDVTLANTDGSTTTRQAVLLVPRDAAFLDFNEDGCNSEQDLWDLAQFWNQPFPMDADGNQFIDIRDLLFVNLSGACP